MGKKTNKDIEHAEYVYQRDQLKAAMMTEQLDKALVIVEANKHELTELEYNKVIESFHERRREIKHFLMEATTKYAKKLKELGDPKINPETGDIV